MKTVLVHGSHLEVPSLPRQDPPGSALVPVAKPLPGLPPPRGELAEGSVTSAAAYRPARPGVLRTAGSVGAPAPRPTTAEHTAIVQLVVAAPSLAHAAHALQQAVYKLVRVTDATCVWIDWPRRTAMTVTSRASTPVEELVIEVAGSGKRASLGSVIIQPSAGHPRAPCSPFASRPA